MQVNRLRGMNQPPTPTQSLITMSWCRGQFKVPSSTRAVRSANREYLVWIPWHYFKIEIKSSSLRIWNNLLRKMQNYFHLSFHPDADIFIHSTTLILQQPFVAFTECVCVFAIQWHISVWYEAIQPHHIRPDVMLYITFVLLKNPLSTDCRTYICMFMVNLFSTFSLDCLLTYSLPYSHPHPPRPVPANAPHFPTNIPFYLLRMSVETLTPYSSYPYE